LRVSNNKPTPKGASAQEAPAPRGPVEAAAGQVFEALADPELTAIARVKRHLQNSSVPAFFAPTICVLLSGTARAYAALRNAHYLMVRAIFGDSSPPHDEPEAL
jgi:hypothetical protein